MAASLADRTAGLESGRLRVVQQVADAYANLASAQAALTQSGFDVERSRNSQRLSLAERELQFLRERGASTGAIAAAEGRIAAIKRAYRALYLSGKPLAEVREQLAEGGEQSQDVRLMLEFIEQSARGLLR